jgi:hypothetical protein
MNQGKYGDLKCLSRNEVRDVAEEGFQVVVVL